MTDPKLDISGFPKQFKFGVATAAYQIEGTRLGRCGPSHWDKFAHQGGTLNKENGDIACGHFDHWQADLDLIAAAGFDAYRFSTAWPRIYPEGHGQVLDEGLDFYDRLVDGALERGIAPHATLYHWDLPMALADKGGWTNPDTARWFADYAVTVADRIGDRLASIATINEPWCVAWLSHFLGHHAPGTRDLGQAVKAMHNILFAHGCALSALRDEDHGNLGIVLNMEYAQAASEADPDQRAARLFDGIYNRWFIEGLIHGTYPDDVMEFFAPHMPQGWQEQMAVISQPMDWLGLNYYTRSIHADDGTNVFPFDKTVTGPLQKSSMGWEEYPDGLAFFLNRLQSDYTHDLPIYVTENGMAGHDVIDTGGVMDADRIRYFQRHLDAVQSAIQNGVPVQGYFAWSLMDNFEWAFGYSERFGIVHVDFETLKRTPKQSYHAFQNALQARR